MIDWLLCDGFALLLLRMFRRTCSSKVWCLRASGDGVAALAAGGLPPPGDGERGGAASTREAGEPPAILSSNLQNDLPNFVDEPSTRLSSTSSLLVLLPICLLSSSSEPSLILPAQTLESCWVVCQRRSSFQRALLTTMGYVVSSSAGLELGSTQ